MKRALILIILSMSSIIPLVAADQYQPIRHPNGRFWPTISGSTNTGPGTGYEGWLEPYDVFMNGVPIPAMHIGKDLEGSPREPVFAVASGEVIDYRTDLTGYGPNGGLGGALIAQFKTSDGNVFRVLYGHIDNPHVRGPIRAGDILEYTNGYDPSHLHFGIHLGNEAPSDSGRNGYRGFIRNDEYAGDTYGWVDPINYLNTHVPGPYNEAAGPSSANIPPTVHECETHGFTFYGTWTLEGDRYKAAWVNGAMANLMIDHWGLLM